MKIFLHGLHPQGLPPYKLTLKKRCPVILLQNLNSSDEGYNNTGFICRRFEKHLISAIASDD